MTISPLERGIRAGLPVVRFMQTCFPLPLARPLLRRSVAQARLSADMAREAVSADGVPCEWVFPRHSPSDQVLLYLHGGGFVFGLTPQHLRMGEYLARRMGVRVLMVDYRLAPDHGYPAALDDCVTAYRWLLRQGVTAQSIVVAGDSAGGNLAITMLLTLRDSGDALPAAAACLSPVTDLTPQDDRCKAIRDPLLPPKAMRLYSRSYVGHADARDPLISPVYGDLRGLPPLLVHVGEDEILRDDAERLANLAQSAGVDVCLQVYARMWHVWQLFLALPQATQSLDQIGEFLHSHMGPRARPTSPA
ncbi:MAG: alpha/beta hydrolase [Chloroflexi bacterium]|nr:alpha/beta hydrolase [Chloroflexota bacterium]